MLGDTAQDTPYGDFLRKESFRLITIESGEWEDTIFCSLRQERLHSASSYEALSYVWGVQAASRPITVNGYEVRVGKNLESALRHIRERGSSSELWVDALCINQNDLSERSSQVERMRDIYSRAALVIVFLGDEMHRCQSTSASNSAIYAKTQGPKGKPTINPSIDAISPTSASDIFSLIAHLGSDDPVSLGSFVQSIGQQRTVWLIEGLRLMLMSPWWSRMWVYQEAILARELVVMYGHASIPWAVLVDASKWRSLPKNRVTSIHEQDQRVLDQFARQIQDIHTRRAEWRIDIKVTRARNKELAARNFLAMLRATAHRKASDDKDKVYALIGLVGDLSLIPDYSVSTGQAYTAVARSIISCIRGFNGLIDDSGRKIQLGLPSWLPDWSSPVDNLTAVQAPAIEHYNACGDWKFKCWSHDYPASECLADRFNGTTLGSNLEHLPGKEHMALIIGCLNNRARRPYGLSSHLWIEGIWRGKVSNTSKLYFGDACPKDVLFWLDADDWQPEGVSPGKPRLRRNHRVTIQKLRAFVFDLKFVSGRLQRLKENDLDSLREWCGLHLHSQRSGEDSISDPLGFASVLKLMSYKQRQFSINLGGQGWRWGWGPMGLKAGDDVFILPGSSVPVALRSIEPQSLGNDSRKCLVIGGCFLFGSMDGENVIDHKVDARTEAELNTLLSHELISHHLDDYMRDPAYHFLGFSVDEIGWKPSRDRMILNPRNQNHFEHGKISPSGALASRAYVLPGLKSDPTRRKYFALED
ncbi:heterokaryon incompatibility protein-domain-containing protein [Xylariaceae sp. FL1272]|nr:heterokaryon incompatibility protein-domain-containing protein [Xylariaceae sp. FL1272]